MTHSERFRPWIVIRLLPKMQRVTVGRFRSWSDADGHLRALQRLVPGAQFRIIFDPEDC
ncbi:hypothetical protein [Phormidesmis priestleyi]